MSDQELLKAAGIIPDRTENSKNEITELIRQPEHTELGATWPAPIPFNDYELPAFRYDIYPTWLSNYIEQEAESTQTPPELAGMLILAIVAAAVCKKAVVLIRPGWKEPLNIFTVTGLVPASRKSAVFSDSLEPVVEYEEQITADFIPVFEDKQIQRKILEGTLARIQTEAVKAKGVKLDELINEAQALARELAETKIKALPRLVADDCSPEKLAGLLSEQSGKIAVFAPEGDIFDIMAGRYSSGTPNLGVYLRGHAGDTIRIDRVGRPPEYVQGPALTVGACVQPEVLQGLIRKPTFKGRGLLGRFLYSLPKTNIGSRKIKTKPVTAEVVSVYKRNIKKLYALPCNNEPHNIKLSAEAEMALNEFETWLEPQLSEFGTLGSIQDWAGKLAGAVARIAGILHMAENVNEHEPWDLPIHGDTMSGTIILSDYLISHARAAYDEMGANPDIEAARYVLKWITNNHIERFTKRDAHRDLQGKFKRADELNPALSILVERRYIQEIENKRDGAGRKSSPIYEVNPHCVNTVNCVS